MYHQNCKGGLGALCAKIMIMQQQKLRIGFVYGGKSSEHEVSLTTAFAVMGALDYTKYEIIPFYITRDGQWRVGKLQQRPFQQQVELKLEAETTYTIHAIQSLFTGTDKAVDRTMQSVDIMFPLIHGPNGEDGTIQGLFEMANIPYVGAGVLASAIGMDKTVMKRIFACAELPQCKYIYFTEREWESQQARIIGNIEAELRYPCFIKPANLGSSVGIGKANHTIELQQAIAVALRYDRKVIVEQFIAAREVEISVLGNDDVEVSVPGEVISANDFYDYQAKYIDEKSQIIIPAPLNVTQLECIRNMAIQAFRAIDGTGLARVDFFIRNSDQRIFINEINTMPGFTPVSMYPLMWKKTGLSYCKLLDRLIELAQERYRLKPQVQAEYT